MYMCSLTFVPLSEISTFVHSVKMCAQLAFILWNHFFPLWLGQAERDLLKDRGDSEFWRGTENHLNATMLGETARKEPNHTSCLRQGMQQLLLPLLSTDHPPKTWGDNKHGNSHLRRDASTPLLIGRFNVLCTAASSCSALLPPPGLEHATGRT